MIKLTIEVDGADATEALLKLRGLLDATQRVTLAEKVSEAAVRTPAEVAEIKTEAEAPVEKPAELTPGQKAAATRKANKAAKEAATEADAEKPAEITDNDPLGVNDEPKPIEKPAEGVSDSDFQTQIGEIASSMVQGGKRIKALMAEESISKLRDVAPTDREAFLAKARGLK